VWNQPSQVPILPVTPICLSTSTDPGKWEEVLAPCGPEDQIELTARNQCDVWEGALLNESCLLSSSPGSHFHAGVSGKTVPQVESGFYDF
jgi:hypothetical protein